MLLVLHGVGSWAEQVGAAPEQVLKPWLERVEDASTLRAPESAG
jgi:hypothetical protein